MNKAGFTYGLVRGAAKICFYIDMGRAGGGGGGGGWRVADRGQANIQSRRPPNSISPGSS